MPDDRNHDHYVFQDLDLFGNEIKQVKRISSNGDITLESTSSDKKILIKSDTSLDKSLTVDGKSYLNDNVVIANEKTLTISGVRIEWDDTSRSLLFFNTNNTSTESTDTEGTNP